jgi:hypothetical protein
MHQGRFGLAAIADVFVGFHRAGSAAGKGDVDAATVHGDVRNPNVRRIIVCAAVAAAVLPLDGEVAVRGETENGLNGGRRGRQDTGGHRQKKHRLSVCDRHIGHFYRFTAAFVHATPGIIVVFAIHVK